MMRASLSPLAHLVDGVAARWALADSLQPEQQECIRQEILRSFRLGNRDELTFHGHLYLLTIRRVYPATDDEPRLLIETHEIVQS